LVDAIALSVSILAFSVGAIADFRTREVSDRLWLIYGPLGVILTTIRFILNPSVLILGLASIGLSSMIALCFFYLGLVGGADSKGFICLAATLPLTPSNINPVIRYVLPFFPVTVLLSSFACSATISIWMVLKNLKAYKEDGSRMFQGLDEAWYSKLLVAFIGFRVKPEQLKSNNFLYPLEVVDGSDSKRRLRLSFNVDADREQDVTQLLYSLGKSNSAGKVWVTPALPMLLFSLIGLLVTISVGDIVMGSIINVIGRPGYFFG
jgi:Flp pilus assembly protein protease CpaA